MNKLTLSFACLGLLAATPPVQAQTALNLQGNWKIVGWTLPDAVPVRGSLPILRFDGTAVSGSAGCNRLSGTATVSGDQITFSALALTKMACPPAVALQETALLDALSGKTVTAVRSADSLTLQTEGGGMLNILRSTVQGK